MIPPCFNRPPYAAGRVLHGISRETGLSFHVYLSNAWFEDVCRVWDGTDVGPNGARYPEAHGWDCRGCRWLPEAFA